MSDQMQRADQAHGLRRLFPPAELRIIPVAGAVPAAARVAIVVNLAASAALDGYSVLILDQSHGDVARAMGLRPRYELLHLLQGEKEFGQAALSGPGGVRVLSAARGMEMLAREGGQALALFQAFAGLSRPADLVLVNLDDPVQARPLLPGSEGELLLVARPDPAAITGAYALIKQLTRHCDLTRFRLLFVDMQEAVQAESLARHMGAVAGRFLAAQLAYAGCVPADPQYRAAELAMAAVVTHAPQSAAAAAFRRISACMPDWSSFRVRRGVANNHSLHGASQ